MSIPIINDDLLEDREIFDVAFSVNNKNTVGARMGRPRVAQVAIISEDGK